MSLLMFAFIAAAGVEPDVAVEAPPSATLLLRDARHALGAAIAFVEGASRECGRALPATARALKDADVALAVLGKALDSGDDAGTHAALVAALDVLDRAQAGLVLCGGEASRRLDVSADLGPDPYFGDAALLFDASTTLGWREPTLPPASDPVVGLLVVLDLGPRVLFPRPPPAGTVAATP